MKSSKKWFDRGIDKSLFQDTKIFRCRHGRLASMVSIDVTESVKKSVRPVRNHPLMDPKVPVHGLVIDPATGQLDTIVDGY